MADKPSTDTPFANRRQAGRQLAARLLPFRNQHPLVLAIPRGGVPVGFEVALALGAPLDLVLVRKISAPFRPEFAVGAVVDGEYAEIVLNRDVIKALNLSDALIREEAARELAEIERRRKVYLGDRPRPPIQGQTAIVVDDGIATGATVRAALIAVRRNAPGRIVLAVPVAPPDSIERLRHEVDEIVCLQAPEPFFAISQHYVEFPQLTDAEVTDLLDRANRSRRSDDKRSSGKSALSVKLSN